MRDAHVNEMIDSHSTGRVDARADRYQVDLFELIGFAGCGMRRSDQVNQRIARAQRACDLFIVERVTDHGRGFGRHTVNRLLTGEHPYTMTTRRQWRNETAADVSGAACDEYIERSWHDEANQADRLVQINFGSPEFCGL